MALLGGTRRVCLRGGSRRDVLHVTILMEDTVSQESLRQPWFVSRGDLSVYREGEGDPIKISL